MTTAQAFAIDHMRLRLRPLNRALRVAVENQNRIAARLIRPDVTPLCVTGDQVKILLDDVDALLREDILLGEPALLTQEEHCAEENLRQRSKTAHIKLPLDRLSEELNLSAFEQEAVLLCAAPELDRSYERIYAYILDDLNRRYPCVELLCSLTAASLAERLKRRFAVGRFGWLRRTGILQAHGEPATEIRQELRLASGMFEFLTGATAQLLSLFRDQEEVVIPNTINLPPEFNQDVIQSLGRNFVEGSVEVVGIWGSRYGAHDEVAMAIASKTGHRLRRWLPAKASQHHLEQEQKLRESIQTAAALDALLWIQTDELNDQGNEHVSQAVVDLLAASRVPVILTGIFPWRPVKLLAARLYTELELDVPDYHARKTMWERALPELGGEQLEDLAARFRVNETEVHAAAQVARTQAKVASNGNIANVTDQLETACAAVTRQRSHHFAILVKPKRGPEDLILPASLHRQVIEVAQFFRVWPRVAEGWGFGHLTTGEGGIKTLFTGDSGTGKTLAAEVIAGLAKMPLLKVNLARILSKWVGETEAHLEAAFNEAEESHAVLFFDECDSLFGKRGEIQHGTDRYANLEVSYLLQRLEDHYGLVILASNLKDNIDTAFTRRFQIVIHFPRPEPAERHRIWQIAFPKAAPVNPEVDFDALARLDMTGAGIVSAAQTAALMAADQASQTITMEHVVQAVARQYRREARIITASDLQPYSAFLHESR